MKIKSVWRWFIIMTCLGTLFSTGLLDVYKKGVIKIIPDPGFGKGVDWEPLFFDCKKDLLVTPENSIFISNNRTHNFYKFSADGQLLGTYSREGRGPGDLYFPGLKTCLDGKYLVFSEYSSNRKISVFDLSGKCVATLHSKADCYGAIGLKNGCVAYCSHKFEPEKKNGKSVSTVSIHIVSMTTKTEIEFPLGVIYVGFIKAGGNMSIIMSQSYLGDVIIDRTGDGNLMAGVTNSPDVRIFSPDGKLIKTFRLNIEPISVTARYIEKQKQSIINDANKNQTDGESRKIIKKAIEKSDFGNLFGEYLPYYKTIVVDSEGNFLVFKWLDIAEKSKETFQVYSPDGKYLCETVLDKGSFDIDVARNFQTMQFTGTGFYGIVKDAADEDIIRLVRVKF